MNAQAAGAEAVIIFNQGNSPDREALIVGTLGDFDVNIPAVGASFADGVASPSPARRHGSASSSRRPAPTST